ncbi:Heat shock factor protein 5 [Chelonia mydas]|uniref:Heat shock factor protein 5 n=1 Tax=Chelonia mydas TaxID=8469 RepID=M7AXT5_CHEMY|nr:Heat shock factor protein 5 [Chelonia mydas]
MKKVPPPGTHPAVLRVFSSTLASGPSFALVFGTEEHPPRHCNAAEDRREVVLGPPGGSSAAPGPAGGGSSGPLHHFHSPHFRRDRPDLLVHLKRLTSANKAKLAAGLEVTSRPPNRFQRLAGHPPPWGPPPAPPRGREKPGALTIGQFHRSFRRDSLSPYSYVSASSHNHSTLSSKGSDRTPVPPRTWQNSLGMLPGQVETSPTFSDKGVPFPVLQRFPTEVTYTLQPSATSVHIQQGPQTMASSSQKYSNYTPSAQYSQTYYPTGESILNIQDSEDYPPSRSPSFSIVSEFSANDSVSVTSFHCILFSQNPPMQSSYPVEFLPSNWPCNTADENKKTEVNLEAVFQIVDEMHSSPKLEMVKVEPVENQCPTPQPNAGQQLIGNPGNNDAPSSSHASQLEPLTPVGSDITFMVGTDQAIACSLPRSSEFIYTIHTTEPVENTAAQMVQEPADTQEAHAKLKEQMSHASAQSSVVFLQEGLPFSPEQVWGKGTLQYVFLYYRIFCCDNYTIPQ